jgi:hypothetical protein
LTPRRRRFLAAAGAIAIVVLGSVVALRFFSPTHPTAGLVSLVGSLQVKRSTGSGFTPVHTGDAALNGDLVRTGPASRAAIDYPSGSITRLDEVTTVTVSGLSGSGPSRAEEFVQLSGKTWTKVQQLSGGARFGMTAANGTALDVRGTEFSVYVEAAGVRFDGWSGTLEVSARGSGVTVGAGLSTTVGPGSAPSPPAPIPIADRQDPWTLFNQALDAGAGTPVAYASGLLGMGGSVGPTPGAEGDGSSDLLFVLSWPSGSTFQLSVLLPDGSVTQPTESVSGLDTIRVPRAKRGLWKYYIVDVASAGQVPWQLVISRVPAH